MTARIAIGAALLSGTLMWVASPAVGVAPLAWVALVPAATVAIRLRGRALGRLAVPLAYAIHLELLLVPALPFGLTEGQWGDAAVPVLIGDSPLLPVALVAIPLLAAILYLVRFGSPWAIPGLPAVAVAVLVPALAWTALDFVRANLDPGGPWGSLYLSQAAAPPGALAALGGPWLVTLAIVAVNYSLGLAVAAPRGRGALRGRVAASAVAAALVALAFASPVAFENAGGERRIAVAAVQPGYDTSEDERPELRYFLPGSYHRAALDVIDDLAVLTRLAAQRGAELVVWPEGTAFVDPRAYPRVRGRIRTIAERTGAVIVVPFFRYRFSESAVLAAAPGEPLGVARPKRRPMWFLGERAVGGEIAPLRAAGIAIGPLLGVDAQDPRVAGELVDRGAGVLASSTHDWRGLAVQQRAAARLEARAAGAPLVRADWRFGSAIYTASGEVLVDAGTDRRRAALLAPVELASPTAYARIGDVVAWLALAAMTLCAVGASWRGLRRPWTAPRPSGAGLRAPRTGR